MNCKIITKKGEAIGIIIHKNNVYLPYSLGIWNGAVYPIHPDLCRYAYIDGMLFCSAPPSHFIYNSFSIGADIKIVKKIEDILKIKIIE